MNLHHKTCLLDENGHQRRERLERSMLAITFKERLRGGGFTITYSFMTAGQTQGYATTPVSARLHDVGGRAFTYIHVGAHKSNDTRDCRIFVLVRAIWCASYNLTNTMCWRMQTLNTLLEAECFVQNCPDEMIVAGSEEGDKEEDDHKTTGRSEDEDGNDREARQRKLNYSTKVFEGVPIIVKGDC